MNYYRPIALTSNVMKCFERLLLNMLNSQVSHFDSSQFAYRSNRGVEDAVTIFLQKLYNHLDAPKSFVRSTFIDCSNAFNSIVPHILIDKLLSLDVTPQLALVIHNFLLDRPQRVKCNNMVSSVKHLSIGAP